MMPRNTFGPFFIDPADRRLMRSGRRVAVPAKAWQILRLMAEAGGRLVPHATFRAKLWPNVVVEDRTLTVHVSTLRKALRSSPPEDYIETVARAGYRLAVPVRAATNACEKPRTNPVKIRGRGTGIDEKGLENGLCPADDAPPTG